MALLLRGLRGEPVKRLQEKLGVDADGIFGGGTEKALKAYQTEHNLAADGIAGPDTFASMGLYDLILLKRGSKGNAVRAVQTALGIDADGKFGPGTERAVRAYQEENGLDVDGLVGPKTLAKLDIAGLGGAPAVTAAAEAAKAAWESLDETTAGALDRVKSLFS